ncbi:MAG: 3-hydroxylacyl-ACP dehydratase [Treponema sp.]|nr:3-hydroxylacyl-ACP dehydratase [Treponema sp.]
MMDTSKEMNVTGSFWNTLPPESIPPATVDVPQFISTDELLSFVPHRGKMFLLSRVTAHDVQSNSIVAEYDISKDCILYDENLGGVPTWAGFEMMAQGISALCTIQLVAHGKAEEAAPGVILSVSGFRSSTACIALGKTVEIKICEGYRVENVCRYDCKMYERGSDKLLAQSSITVMGIDDMQSFFSKME